MAAARTAVIGPGAIGAVFAAAVQNDREAGRELEWEARNDVVRRLGARHGIATPVSDVIVPLLAAAGDGPG